MNAVSGQRTIASAHRAGAAQICRPQRLQTGRQQLRGLDRARNRQRAATSRCQRQCARNPDSGRQRGEHHALLELVRSDPAAAGGERERSRFASEQAQMIVIEVDDIMRFRATASEER